MAGDSDDSLNIDHTGDPGERPGHYPASEVVMELSIEQARAYYPGDDPVHGFDHVMRVYRIAERLGREEGADLEILHTARERTARGTGLSGSWLRTLPIC